MRLRRSIPALFAATAMAAAACSPDSEPATPPVEPTPAPIVPAGAPVTLACEQGGAVTVAYPDPATAQVTHDGQTWLLREEGSATGALFVDTAMTWRTVVADGMETSTLSRRAPNGGVEVAVVARCSRPAPPPVTAGPLASAAPAEGVAPSAAPCRFGQLRLVSHSSDAGAGNRNAVLAMQNTGVQPCSLTGYPGVVLRDRQGRDLSAIRVEPTLRGVAAGGQPAPVDLPAQGRAFFDIGWTVVPDESRGGQPACPAVTALRVTAPGDTTALPLTLALSPCGGRVRVSPFRSTPDPDAAPEAAAAASAGVQTARKTA